MGSAAIAPCARRSPNYTSFLDARDAPAHRWMTPDERRSELGSCFRIKLGQGRTDRCPDCKQSCPCRRVTAAANHGVDLLSGCRSLGLRYTLIPRRRVSNAIVCDFKKRMSSIRRSSLSSTTLLGMFTVIDATFVCLSVRMADGLQQIFVWREIQKQICLSIITLNNTDLHKLECKRRARAFMTR